MERAMTSAGNADLDQYISLESLYFDISGTGLCVDGAT
jgi:hypothetical protein